MRFKIRLLIGFPALVVASLAVFLVVIYLAGDPLNLKAPRDQDLMETFDAHRDRFEKIRLMANEDEQKGWYLGVSQMSNLGDSRQHEYKDQISRIQSRLDVRLDGHDKVLRYIFSGGGFLLAIGPGWAKGIEYIPTDYLKQGILTTNLDGMRKMPPGVYLRQIETNWFIFYQKTD
jgi:hypothetical protein